MKKGFTLIELLAVITILGIISTIATVNFIKLKENSSKELLDTKIKNLEAAAIVYGQENQDKLNFSCIVNETEYSYCIKVSVKTLIDKNYFKSTEIGSSGSVNLINNVTKESMLDDEVQIYRKNNSIYAKYIE